MAKNLQIDSTTGLPTGATDPAFDGPIVVPKASGDGGVKVDTTTPTWTWRDLRSEVKVDRGGTSAPAWAQYIGSIYEWQFGQTGGADEVFSSYHLDHDYVEGTDVHIHCHWTQKTVDTGGPASAPGDVKWYFEVTYAKGHDQAAFISPITTSVVQTASGTQYQHMIAEVQLSAASPTASQIDTDDLEPDGLFLVRIYRDAADAADTLDQGPFLLFVDIHYQSSNIGTKNRNPGFYT